MKDQLSYFSALPRDYGVESTWDIAALFILFSLLPLKRSLSQNSKKVLPMP